MSKLTYDEVMQRVQWLENDAGLRELHDRARKSWHPLFAMTHMPTMPESLTRGLSVSMPSPRLRDMKDGLVADMAAYQAAVTVSAHGKDGPPSADLKSKADKVERFASVLRSVWNGDGKLRGEGVTGELVDCYFVVILQCGDIATKDNPWSLVVPDPLSCYFPVTGTPFRPKMMSRRYKQAVQEIESRYSRRARTSHANDYLRKRNGAWKWEPIGDDVSAEDANTRAVGGDSKWGEEQDFIWFADEEYIYHIALNDQNGGEIVYCEENLTGGCPALVISGATSHLREARERIGPALLPIIQCVLNLNLIRAIRATKALNSRPDMLIEMTPETFTQAQDAGVVQQTALQEGVPNLISVSGKPVPWQIAPDEDLAKLEESWGNELTEYVTEWKEPTDPTTVADATANAYITAVAAIRRRQTPLLKNLDWMDAQLLDMVLYSIKNHYKRDISLHASGQVMLNAGEIGAGEGVTISPADLDFDYDVAVTTRAVTESEQRAREELGMQRVAWGIGTVEEVIEGAYPDATQQLKKLAIDTAIRIVQPVMMTQLDQTWRDRVRLRSGILLPPGGVVQQPRAPDQVGQSPMQPAAIGQAEGGEFA